MQRIARIASCIEKTGDPQGRPFIHYCGTVVPEVVLVVPVAPLPTAPPVLPSVAVGEDDAPAPMPPFTDELVESGALELVPAVALPAVEPLALRLLRDVALLDVLEELPPVDVVGLAVDACEVEPTPLVAPPAEPVAAPPAEPVEPPAVEPVAPPPAEPPVT